jgi:rhamnosyltransferase
MDQVARHEISSLEKGMLKNWARIILHALRMLLPQRVKERLRPVLSGRVEKIAKAVREPDRAVTHPQSRTASPIRAPITHVSVVIPTKNAGRLFAEVLEKIQAQQCCYPVRVTIVDSGSTDDTVAVAQRNGATIMSIDPKQFNHGLTRNLAIENTAGEIVVLLTQDAFPGDTQLIRNLVKAFDDPLVAGVYGRQIPRQEADVLTRRNLNRWLTGRMKAEINFLGDRPIDCAMTPYQYYEFCNFDNVCSAIRKSVWEEIPFRANEFAEDLDWSKRVLEAGWKIAYEPTAFVVHSHQRSVAYEFKRTYLCHRKLYNLFGLEVLPSWPDLAFSLMCSICRDWLYATKHESNFRKCVSLWIRTPIYNFATAYAQYRGARDEKLLRKRKIEGV